MSERTPKTITLDLSDPIQMVEDARKLDLEGLAALMQELANIHHNVHIVGRHVNKILSERMAEKAAALTGDLKDVSVDALAAMLPLSEGN